MSHLDPERLALLALGNADDGAAGGHLASCPACTTELATLRELVLISGEARELHDLPPPPATVWSGIEAALTTADPTYAPARTDAPAQSQTPGRVDELAVRRARRASRPWLTHLATAVAAAAVAVVGTLTLVPEKEADPAPTVTARIDLQRLDAAPPTLAGFAQLLDDNGTRRLHIHATGLPASDQDYEVWLLDASSIGAPGGLRMKSIGSLTRNSDETFPLPDGLDLADFRIVDISAEPHDGNATHSGRSLLRGALTT